MPMWGSYWGPPWVGFSWMFPLIGLFFMVIMIVFCVRMIGGMAGCAGMGGHGGHRTVEIDDLRREVQALKEDVRKLRERS